MLRAGELQRIMLPLILMGSVFGVVGPSPPGTAARSPGRAGRW
jgi:hypothetical protein